jgi:hypothetical protein
MEDDKVNHPREDDRNDEIEESPAPDPEATDATADTAEDDPEAD